MLAINSCVMDKRTRAFGYVRQVSGQDCVIEWRNPKSAALSLVSRSEDELDLVDDVLTDLEDCFPGISFELDPGAIPKWSKGCFKIIMSVNGVKLKAATWNPVHQSQPTGILICFRTNNRTENYSQSGAALLVERIKKIGKV